MSFTLSYRLLVCENRLTLVRDISNYNFIIRISLSVVL